MRINLGNKVEAWCGDPSMGGWRLGVVVWGNGHQYNIRWDGGDVVSGRIRRVSVRPPPPHLEIPADLEAGDLVEALDDRMWKLAELVRAGDGDGEGEFTVKIVGSPSAITVPPSMVRVRQVLTDGDIWVATYKGEEIPGAREPTARPNAAANRRAPAAAAKHRPAADQFAPPPAPSHQWAKIKRSRHATDHDAAGEVRRVEANSKRIRAMEEEEGELLVGYGNVEVVRANEPPPTAVFVNKQQEMSDEETDDDAKSVSSAGSGSSSNSESSSDGSSSESDNGDRAAPRSPPGDAQVAANQPPPPPSQPQCQPHIKEERADDDDVRTKSRGATAMKPRPAVAPIMQRRLANERPPPPLAAAAAAVGEQIHRLEVDAYGALMRVLHATGALSWEKEELLTQLRLQLHVSSDEHLQLIRALNGGRRRLPKPEN
ncbi:myosin-1-like [Oryza glaberrima]|uniref:ENT domain-containing protein n=1 Tax=Oryza glaberrima TaxID=4538 RepID=I1NPK7_ORYGL|nr:myosin-1-like [Oryza glaberrima]